MSWLPYVVLMIKVELVVPWWLENRGRQEQAIRRV